MTNKGTPLVEMRDISISFGGIKAVDHVTIDLHPGEVVGLLGHNGAGKSTLMKPSIRRWRWQTTLTPPRTCFWAARSSPRSAL